jgi:hypothetical protein
MEKLLSSEELRLKKHLGDLKNFIVPLFFALTITWCSSRSPQEIEAELSDVESELLTRGENQRIGINKDGNIYKNHFWKWDDKQIADMERWTAERKIENEKEYNKLIEKRNELTKELDEANAREARGNQKSTYELTGTNYDENQFENSDKAIIESMKNRKSK